MASTFIYVSKGLLKGFKKLSSIYEKSIMLSDNFIEKKMTIMKDYLQCGFFFVYAIGTLTAC